MVPGHCSGVLRSMPGLLRQGKPIDVPTTLVWLIHDLGSVMAIMSVEVRRGLCSPSSQDSKLAALTSLS